MRIHHATLTILGRFLDEQALLRKVTPMQYQRILDTLVPVLTSNYQSEPDVQQQAMQILVRQCRVSRCQWSTKYAFREGDRVVAALSALAK